MSQTLTKEAVAAHKKPDDLWIIVDDDVYDLTKFQTEHPGGQKILQRVAGKDASKQFWKYHNESVLKKYKAQLQIGSLEGKKSAAAPPTPPTTPPPSSQTKNDKVEPSTEPGTVAPVPGKNAHEAAESLDPYGALIPYADPSWYQSYHSPYFNESHAALRAEVREWVENEIEPNVTEWDEAKTVPGTIYKQMGERGYLAGLMGLHKYPTDKTSRRVKSVSPEKWDLFHELLLTDEISRAGSGGLVWNLLGGFGIGCPPLVKFGKKSLVDRILPAILDGDKRICLAITEPDAGSDVANLTCEAKLTDDGKHYIVNGEKKWITNGIWCDYFTTAVRTGGPGMNGVSALLIERDNGGVSTRRMDCQGVWSSGTTYITFEDVKVPVENLIGKENQGFKGESCQLLIMTNFNHERIGIIIQCIRFSRVCYEESIKYAHKRKTFGKKLIDHPVIRLKLAHMARQIEASYNWLENLIHQCQMMSDTEAMLKLGGAIAGLKAQATTTFEFCAREASQIFGGLSYSRGGQGAKVERLYRDVRAYAIPGGSEEIMLDLSIRQSLRVHKALGMKLTRFLQQYPPTAMDATADFLRPYLLPLTTNLPAPLVSAGHSLLGRKCYKTLLLDVSPSPPCLRLALSKTLGIGIITLSSVVKIPQILKLLTSQSSSGLSFLAYLLETVSYGVTLAYSARKGFPFSTYGETALIAAQDLVIGCLVLHFEGRDVAMAGFAAGVIGGVGALMGDKGPVDMGVLGTLQAGAGALGVASKVPQIWTVWRNGGTGQLSAFAVFTYLFGSLSRIFTTVQEVDDKLILYGFVAGFLLNAVLALQMLYYWSSPATASHAGEMGQKPKQVAMGTSTGASVKPKTPTTRRRG